MSDPREIIIELAQRPTGKASQGFHPGQEVEFKVKRTSPSTFKDKKHFVITGECVGTVAIDVRSSAKHKLALKEAHSHTLTATCDDAKYKLIWRGDAWKNPGGANNRSVTEIKYRDPELKTFTVETQESPYFNHGEKLTVTLVVEAASTVDRIVRFKGSAIDEPVAMTFPASHTEAQFELVGTTKAEDDEKRKLEVESIEGYVVHDSIKSVELTARVWTLAFAADGNGNVTPPVNQSRDTKDLYLLNDEVQFTAKLNKKVSPPAVEKIRLEIFRPHDQAKPILKVSGEIPKDGTECVFTLPLAPGRKAGSFVEAKDKRDFHFWQKELRFPDDEELTAVLVTVKGKTESENPAQRKACKFHWSPLPTVALAPHALVDAPFIAAVDESRHDGVEGRLFRLGIEATDTDYYRVIAGQTAKLRLVRKVSERNKKLESEVTVVNAKGTKAALTGDIKVTFAAGEIEKEVDASVADVPKQPENIRRIKIKASKKTDYVNCVVDVDDHRRKAALLPSVPYVYLPKDGVIPTATPVSPRDKVWILLLRPSGWNADGKVGTLKCTTLGQEDGRTQEWDVAFEAGKVRSTPAEIELPQDVKPGNHEFEFIGATVGGKTVLCAGKLPVLDVARRYAYLREDNDRKTWIPGTTGNGDGATGVPIKLGISVPAPTPCKVLVGSTHASKEKLVTFSPGSTKAETALAFDRWPDDGTGLNVQVKPVEGNLFLPGWLPKIFTEEDDRTDEAADAFPSSHVTAAYENFAYVDPKAPFKEAVGTGDGDVVVVLPGDKLTLVVHLAGKVTFERAKVRVGLIHPLPVVVEFAQGENRKEVEVDCSGKAGDFKFTVEGCDRDFETDDNGHRVWDDDKRAYKYDTKGEGFQSLQKRCPDDHPGISDLTVRVSSGTMLTLGTAKKADGSPIASTDAETALHHVDADAWIECMDANGSYVPLAEPNLPFIVGEKARINVTLNRKAESEIKGNLVCPVFAGGRVPFTIANRSFGCPPVNVTLAKPDKKLAKKEFGYRRSGDVVFGEYAVKVEIQPPANKKDPPVNCTVHAVADPETGRAHHRVWCYEKRRLAFHPNKGPHGPFIQGDTGNLRVQLDVAPQLAGAKVTLAASFLDVVKVSPPRDPPETPSKEISFAKGEHFRDVEVKFTADAEGDGNLKLKGHDGCVAGDDHQTRTVLVKTPKVEFDAERFKEDNESEAVCLGTVARLPFKLDGRCPKGGCEVVVESVLFLKHAFKWKPTATATEISGEAPRYVVEFTPDDDGTDGIARTVVEIPIVAEMKDGSTLLVEGEEDLAVAAETDDLVHRCAKGDGAPWTLKFEAGPRLEFDDTGQQKFETGNNDNGFLNKAKVFEVDETAAIKVKPSEKTKEKVRAQVRSSAFGSKVYAVEFPAESEAAQTVTVTFAAGGEPPNGDKRFIYLESVDAQNWPVRPDRRVLEVKVKKKDAQQPCGETAESGSETLRAAPISGRMDTYPDDPCNLKRLWVELEHGKDGKAVLNNEERKEYETPKRGPFEIVRARSQAEKAKQALVYDGGRVPVIQVLAAHPGDDNHVKNVEETIHHATAYVYVDEDRWEPKGTEGTDKSRRKHYCSSVFEIRQEDHRHPTVFCVDRTLHQKDSQERKQDETVEHSGAVGAAPLDVVVSRARLADSARRYNWAPLWPAIAKLPADTKKKLGDDDKRKALCALALYTAHQVGDRKPHVGFLSPQEAAKRRSKVGFARNHISQPARDLWRMVSGQLGRARQYLIEVRSCGLPDVSDGTPMAADNLKVVLEVFPSDEYCLYVGNSAGSLMSERLEEGKFVAPGEGFDPKTGFDIEHAIRSVGTREEDTDADDTVQPMGYDDWKDKDFQVTQATCSPAILGGVKADSLPAHLGPRPQKLPAHLPEKSKPVVIGIGGRIRIDANGCVLDPFGRKVDKRGWEVRADGKAYDPDSTASPPVGVLPLPLLESELLDGHSVRTKGGKLACTTGAGLVELVDDAGNAIPCDEKTEIVDAKGMVHISSDGWLTTPAGLLAVPRVAAGELVTDQGRLRSKKKGDDYFLALRDGTELKDGNGASLKLDPGKADETEQLAVKGGEVRPKPREHMRIEKFDPEDTPYDLEMPSAVWYPYAGGEGDPIEWDPTYKYDDTANPDGTWTGGNRTAFGTDLPSVLSDDSVGSKGLDSFLNNSWLPFAASIEFHLIRNGSLAPPADDGPRAKIQAFIKVLSAIVDAINKRSNSASQACGFGVGVKFDFLKGHLVRYWGWKECNDQRVYRWSHLAAEIMVFSFEVEGLFGWAAGFAGKSIEAVIYLKVGTSLHLGGKSETNALDKREGEETHTNELVVSYPEGKATKKKNLNEAWVAIKVDAAIGARVVLGDPSWFSIDACIESGFTFRTRFIFYLGLIETEGYFNGIIAKLSVEFVSYFKWEGSKTIMKGDVEGWPRWSATWGTNTEVPLARVNRTISQALGRMTYIRSRYEHVIYCYQELQLFCVADKKLQGGEAVLTNEVPGYRCSARKPLGKPPAGSDSEATQKWEDKKKIWKKERTDWDENKRQWDEQWRKCVAAFDLETHRVPRRRVSLSFQHPKLSERLHRKNDQIKDILGQVFLPKLEELDALEERIDALKNEVRQQLEGGYQVDQDKQVQLYLKAKALRDDKLLRLRDIDGKSSGTSWSWTSVLWAPLGQLEKQIEGLKYYAQKRRHW